MQEAVKRSRREAVAVFWLMSDSFERGDFSGVVENADILLRTQPDLQPQVMTDLGALAAIPEGRSVLTTMLAKRPSWRASFFNALPKNIRYAGTPYALMTALKNAGSPPSSSEVVPYVNALIGAGLVRYAHDIWLELVQHQDRSRASLLINSNFAKAPSGLPFDWSVMRGQNATFDFTPLGDQEGGRSVEFEFGVGRVQFPELSQIVVLEPGHYQLIGEVQGAIRAKRSLRWAIRCWRGKELAQTEMLYGGTTRPWRSFELNIEVPDQDDCRAQQLRLFHDSRSASEELISGHIAFRFLSLKKTDNP